MRSNSSMYRYQFTGEAEEVFPSILATRIVGGAPVTGSLVCQPGDVVELADPVVHARLQPVEGDVGDAVAAELAADRRHPRRRPRRRRPRRRRAR
jgi:hypothetical protein